MTAVAFELPERLAAHEPPAERDAVRMLLARAGGSLEHRRFRDLPRLLDAGDLVVVNTSGTLPAALRAGSLDVHLSTPLPGGPRERWVVELRRDGEPFSGDAAGETVALPGGGSAELRARYLGRRLWVADLRLPEPLLAYLTRHGRPIRYATSAASIRSRRTRRCTRPSRAAPRCRAPAARSRRSS